MSKTFKLPEVLRTYIGGRLSAIDTEVKKLEGQPEYAALVAEVLKNTQGIYESLSKLTEVKQAPGEKG